MKKIAMSLVLACILTTQAVAGDIPTSDAIPPPPNSNHSSSSASGLTVSDDPTSPAPTSETIELLDSLMVSLAKFLVW